MRRGLLADAVPGENSLGSARNRWWSSQVARFRSVSFEFHSVSLGFIRSGSSRARPRIVSSYAMSRILRGDKPKQREGPALVGRLALQRTKRTAQPDPCARTPALLYPAASVASAPRVRFTPSQSVSSELRASTVHSISILSVSHVEARSCSPEACCVAALGASEHAGRSSLHAASSTGLDSREGTDLPPRTPWSSNCCQIPGTGTAGTPLLHACLPSVRH